MNKGKQEFSKPQRWVAQGSSRSSFPPMTCRIVPESAQGFPLLEDQKHADLEGKVCGQARNQPHAATEPNASACQVHCCNRRSNWDLGEKLPTRWLLLKPQQNKRRCKIWQGSQRHSGDGAAFRRDQKRERGRTVCPPQLHPSPTLGVQNKGSEKI